MRERLRATHNLQQNTQKKLERLKTKIVQLMEKSSLVPRPIPSFSMLHAEKWEGLVSEITCAMSIVTQQSSKIWPLNKATVLG